MTYLKIDISKKNVLLTIKVNWFIFKNASMALKMSNLLIKSGHSEKHTKFFKKIYLNLTLGH